MISLTAAKLDNLQHNHLHGCPNWHLLSHAIIWQPLSSHLHSSALRSWTRGPGFCKILELAALGLLTWSLELRLFQIWGSYGLKTFPRHSKHFVIRTQNDSHFLTHLLICSHYCFPGLESYSLFCQRTCSPSTAWNRSIFLSWFQTVLNHNVAKESVSLISSVGSSSNLWLLQICKNFDSAIAFYSSHQLKYNPSLIKNHQWTPWSNFGRKESMPYSIPQVSPIFGGALVLQAHGKCFRCPLWSLGYNAWWASTTLSGWQNIIGLSFQKNEQRWDSATCFP